MNYRIFSRDKKYIRVLPKIEMYLRSNNENKLTREKCLEIVQSEYQNYPYSIDHVINFLLVKFN